MDSKVKTINVCIQKINTFLGYSVREYGKTPPQEVYESIASFIE